MLRALADPYLVRRFQTLCGLKEIKEPREELNRDNKFANGHAGNGYVNGFRPNGVLHKNGYYPKISEEELNKNNYNLPELKEQKYTYNPFFHWLFTLGATLGYEVFYITFFPFVFWNMDEYVARRLVFLWCLFMYVGQCAKDVIQWPRPPCPPVISVEKRFECEYGMPSTHAIVGALIPFTLVYYTYDRYEYPLPVGIAVFVCWCLLVCSSRLYMGMHTLQDVLAGLALTVAMLVVVIPVLDVQLENWVLTSPSAPIFIVAIPLAMCVLYPTPPLKTETKADTIMVVGVGVGVLLASWARFAPTRVPDPYLGTPFLITFPGFDRVMAMLSRFLLGIMILAPTRSVMKALIHMVLPRVLPKYLEPKLEKDFIEHTHRFITYTVVGFNAVFIVPMCFEYFGI
ncbi:sphingosine-1-phosphate phosphatase 2 [Nematostella vectensis]|uniref:sphingosine-1-phosphate phosphatase 2 n=1 Tax=Nematostella vectensis TaxID=45351 RepID=UPI002076E173|nr:sphingosine-1-phosphate phosphatase 2 [Nematostella vectensis]